MTMLETPLDLTPTVEGVRINIHSGTGRKQTLIIEMQNVGVNYSTFQYPHSGETNHQVWLNDASDEFVKDLIKQLAKSLKNKNVL